VDTAPVASSDSSHYLQNDSPFIIQPLANDLDIDADILTISNAACNHGQVSIGANGELIYSVNPEEFCGIDSIHYVVCDIYGLCDSSFVVVEIECPIDLILPEGMSPNGDGINDVLEFIGLKAFPENNLIVFNRWGHIVFEAKNYDNTWNGVSQSPLTLGNLALPNGTYYYFLTLPDQKSLNGFFYLDR
jgi:gliding motility-associated-like protein